MDSPTAAGCQADCPLICTVAAGVSLKIATVCVSYRTRIEQYDRYTRGVMGSRQASQSDRSTMLLASAGCLACFLCSGFYWQGSRSNASTRLLVLGVFAKDSSYAEFRRCSSAFFLDSASLVSNLPAQTANKKVGISGTLSVT